MHAHQTSLLHSDRQPGDQDGSVLGRSTRGDSVRQSVGLPRECSSRPTRIRLSGCRPPSPRTVATPRSGSPPNSSGPSPSITTSRPPSTLWPPPARPERGLRPGLLISTSQVVSAVRPARYAAGAGLISMCGREGGGRLRGERLCGTSAERSSLQAIGKARDTARSPTRTPFSRAHSVHVPGQGSRFVRTVMAGWGDRQGGRGSRTSLQGPGVGGCG